MPMYDFKCKACENTFEVFQKLSEHKSKGKKCPQCGSKKTEQVMTAFRMGAVIGKGDQTTVVVNDDGTPYRLQESTQADQKKEIARKLEEKEQKKIANGEIDPRCAVTYEVH